MTVPTLIKVHHPFISSIALIGTLQEYFRMFSAQKQRVLIPYKATR